MRTLTGSSLLRKPPLWLAFALHGAAVLVWAVLHLVVFHETILPLTFVLPLLVCLWTCDRIALWVMAAAFISMSATKVFWLVPEHHYPDEVDWISFGAQLVNILLAAIVLHLTIGFRQRLEARTTQLEVAGAELVAREEHIARQNEELQTQSEELAQQNEELRSQGEELEQQNEELLSQSEEIHHTNEELAHREEMLRTLLLSAGSIQAEDQVLQDVCRHGLRLLGPDVMLSAVVEQDGSMLSVRAYTGIVPSSPAQRTWPLDRSLAQIVMRESRTACLNDVALRPELIFPSPAGAPAIRSVLATPLRVGNRVIGAVEFYCTRARAWTQDQFRLAEWVAAQCSVVLELVRLSRQLQSSEERYRTLFSTMSEGFALHEIILDDKGQPYDYRFLDANPAFEQFTGLRPDDIRGKTVRQVLPGIESYWIERYGRVALTGEPARFESRAAPLDRDFEVVAYRPSPGQFAVVFSDVTQRKAMERQLIHAREQAESANQAKDRFFAILSHELRTPLNPALMSAALLEDDPDLPCRLREDVTTIRRNIELEARLIDDMLDLTRIARGKLELNRRTINGPEVLRCALEICEEEAREKRLQVTVQTSDGALVDADPIRLQQVFWNLLKNAIKFTGDGGRITVTTAVTGDQRFRVEVADTGAGIEPAMLSRIFDAFEQGSPRVSRQFGGLGLGLAICKGLVELHGGTIRASSPGLGMGSTFTVELPMATEPAGVAAPPVERIAGDPPRSLKVLLVEDHDMTARVTARLLRRFGHEVEYADSVKAAMEIYQRDSFDLVISDLGLPDGTGWDLMRQIRTVRPVKGIALSGYGMDGDVQSSFDAGFAEHLTKPINGSQLELAIRRTMRVDAGK